MPKDRVPSSRLLHVHYRGCPNCPGSKVQNFPSGWVTFAHPYHTRAYAITGKNKWIAGILYSIFTLQIGVAIYMIFWSSTGPSECFHSITRMSSSTKCNVFSNRVPFNSTGWISSVSHQNFEGLDGSSDVGLSLLW